MPQNNVHVTTILGGPEPASLFKVSVSDDLYGYFTFDPLQRLDVLRGIPLTAAELRAAAKTLTDAADDLAERQQAS